MILHLLPTPNLPFISLRLLMEDAGHPVMHVLKKDGKPYQIYKAKEGSPSLPLGSCRFVYAATVKDFLGLEPSLSKASYPICVFLADSPPVLEEYGLKILPIYALDLVTLSQLAQMEASYTPLGPCVSRTPLEVLNAGANDLLLPKIHPLFYRIADKQRREDTRNQAHAYLTGQAEEYRHSGVPMLDRLMESELALKTRSWVIYAAEHGLEKTLVDHPTSDEFELRYLLSQMSTPIKP